MQKSFLKQEQKAQGGIEYLLIIGASILVIAIVIIALVTLTGTATTNPQENSENIKNPLKEQIAETQNKYFIPEGTTEYYKYTGEGTTLEQLANNGENISVCLGDNCDDETLVDNGETITINSTQDDGTIPNANLEPSDPPFDCTTNEQTKFYAGNGTIENPYQICNWTQLSEINNNLDKHFILIQNLNKSRDYQGIGNNWKPIGFDSQENFTGTFNGNEKTIQYLEQTMTGYPLPFGLFAGLNEGKISKLILEDAKIQITGNSNMVGSIVGYMHDGILEEIIIKNTTINGNGNVGGLVGFLNDGTINEIAIKNIMLNGSGAIGGLVGATELGLIQNVYTTGQIQSSNTQLPNIYNAIGGIIGWDYSSPGTLKNSYSSAQVEIETEPGGGLLGGLEAYSVENNFFAGTIHTNSTGIVGGIIGDWYESDPSANPSITNCGWWKNSGASTAIGNKPETQIGYEEDDKTVFYDKEHAIYALWNFDTIWLEQENDFPILKMEN